MTRAARLIEALENWDGVLLPKGWREAAAEELRSVDRLTRELAEAKARAVIPDGWVAVPVEPTPLMLLLCYKATGFARSDCSDIYRAMLSARPEYPPNGLPKESSNVE